MTSSRDNIALRRIWAHVAALTEAGESRKVANEIREDLEFRLTIDHRLGEDLPGDRHESLVSIHRDFRKDLKAAIGRHVRGETTPDEHAATVNDRFRRMVEDYSLVLSPEELRTFVGGDRGSCGDLIDPLSVTPLRARQALPRIDPDRSM